MCRLTFGLAALVVLVACGDDGEERPTVRVLSPETTAEAPTEPAEPTPPTEPTPPAAPATPARPASPPVDLLRAVPTDLATSSVFRHRRAQAAHLVDGDFKTAWNSQSDDVVGAWIDVRIPDDATVTSIEMTVGYTKADTAQDLFTANYRISKVRVLLDGDELLVHEFDIHSRQLQSIPVTGGGGVYRVELLEFRAGEREDWREACISEFRVMGRAPGAQEGARLPRFSTAELPQATGGGEEVDREAVERLVHRRVSWFAEHWIAYEEALYDWQTAELIGEVSPSGRRELRRERNELLRKVLEVVEPVDGVGADGLRIALMNDEGGLEASTTAFHAVADWLEDGTERCWIAKGLAHIQLANVLRGLRREAELTDRDEYEAMESGDGTAGGGPDFYALSERIEDIYLGWQRNGRGGATRLSQLELPAVAESTRAAWDALQAELAIARPTCGWEE